MTGILNALIAGVSGAVKDAYFNLVSLLLPGNGTNGAQNNTFLDGSSNNFTITRNGNTTQGTFSPFSQTGWGNYFIASSGLRLAHTTDFDFSTGNFTVESFIYPVSAYANNNIIVVGALGSGFAALILKINASNQVQLLMSTAGSAWDVNQTSTSTVSLNAWSHIAVVRNGSGSNNLQVYVNGTSYISTTYTSSPVTGGNYEYIATNGTDSFLGYISNARIVKGQALSTGTFTPPTAPISSSIVGWTGANAASSITGTVPLVTCQSNRFVDTSSSPKTITVLGSPSVVAFSPFNPTAKWSAATYGGSGYFDGSGDYLTTPNNSALYLTTNNFTLEGWIYLASTSTTQNIIRGSNSFSIGILQSSGSLIYYISSNGSSWDIASAVSMGSITANAWLHFALVRNGSTFTPYINGVAGTTATSSSSIANTNGLIVFAETGGTLPATGYCSGLRLVNGTAVYTSAFTPPTSPLTAITNTSLLLNFTNAGIYDATSKNDLETVGNAQISTTQSKWGGSSMYFDGTGDYLQCPISTMWDLGTGDFTVELWVYYSTSSRNGSLISYGGYGFASADSAGWSLQINTTAGNLTFSSGTTQNNFISGNTALINSTLPNGQWNHIAVTRQGTNLRCFVNGTQVGSTITNSTSLSGASYTPKIASDQGAAAGSLITGYLDDVRITKGYARYTASFTAPTAPFPEQ